LEVWGSEFGFEVSGSGCSVWGVWGWGFKGQRACACVECALEEEWAVLCSSRSPRSTATQAASKTPLVKISIPLSQPNEKSSTASKHHKARHTAGSAITRGVE